MDLKKYAPHGSIATGATLGVVGLFAVSAISACSVTSKVNEQYQDSHINERYKVHISVYDDADGFPNTAEFCDTGGNMIVTTRHGDVSVIASDPRCKTLPAPRLYYHHS